MPFDECTESQTFVRLPHEDQASVGGNPRSLEIGLQRDIERELKGLLLSLTHFHPLGYGPPHSLLGLDSSKHTGDEYLVYLYHGFSNRKSGFISCGSSIFQIERADDRKHGLKSSCPLVPSEPTGSPGLPAPDQSSDGPVPSQSDESAT